MDERQFWELIYALVIFSGGHSGEAQVTADAAADDWRARWADVIP